MTTKKEKVRFFSYKYPTVKIRMVKSETKMAKNSMTGDLEFHNTHEIWLEFKKLNNEWGFLDILPNDPMYDDKINFLRQCGPYTGRCPQTGKEVRKHIREEDENVRKQRLLIQLGNQVGLDQAINDLTGVSNLAVSNPENNQSNPIEATRLAVQGQQGS